jgi:hypothetical protein
MFFPQEFHHPSTGSPISIYKLHKSVCTALTGIAEWLDTMSFLDSTLDQQFTAYEITPFQKPSADDVVSEPIVRNHPGRRFEKPQGGEARWSPSIRLIAQKVLQKELEVAGYQIPRLSIEKITSQPLEDFLHPRSYLNVCAFLMIRRLSRDEILNPLEAILYASSVDDRFSPTLGTLYSLDTIILDVLPQIRQTLRTEHRRMKPAQVLLNNIWSNKRITRGLAKEEKEGKRRYFGNRIDENSVLMTWLDISTTGNDKDTGSMHGQG